MGAMGVAFDKVKFTIPGATVNGYGVLEISVVAVVTTIVTGPTEIPVGTFTVMAPPVPFQVPTVAGTCWPFTTKFTVPCAVPKFPPEMVIGAFAGACAGEMLVIVGFEPTVNETELLEIPAAVVNTIDPETPPAGMVAVTDVDDQLPGDMVNCLVPIDTVPGLAPKVVP